MKNLLSARHAAEALVQHLAVVLATEHHGFAAPIASHYSDAVEAEFERLAAALGYRAERGTGSGEKRD